MGRRFDPDRAHQNTYKKMYGELEMSSKKNFFIWTEAIGCGEILPPMINSYLMHHDYPLNVFLCNEDLEFISSIKHPMLVIHNLSLEDKKISKKIG